MNKDKIAQNIAHILEKREQFFSIHLRHLPLFAVDEKQKEAMKIANKLKPYLLKIYFCAFK